MGEKKTNGIKRRNRKEYIDKGEAQRVCSLLDLPLGVFPATGASEEIDTFEKRCGSSTDPRCGEPYDWLTTILSPLFPNAAILKEAPAPHWSAQLDGHMVLNENWRPCGIWVRANRAQKVSSAILFHEIGHALHILSFNDITKVGSLYNSLKRHSPNGFRPYSEPMAWYWGYLFAALHGFASTPSDKDLLYHRWYHLKAIDYYVASVEKQALGLKEHVDCYRSIVPARNLLERIIELDQKQEFSKRWFKVVRRCVREYEVYLLGIVREELYGGGVCLSKRDVQMIMHSAGKSDNCDGVLEFVGRALGLDANR
jgi:hypothetical protein